MTTTTETATTATNDAGTVPANDAPVWAVINGRAGIISPKNAFESRAALLAYRRENHPDHAGYKSASPVRVPANWTPAPGLYPLGDAHGHFAVRVSKNTRGGGVRFDVTYDARYVRGYVAGGYASAAINRVFGTFMRASNLAARGFRRESDANGIIIRPVKSAKS
jgi:hypothetical protein